MKRLIQGAAVLAATAALFTLVTVRAATPEPRTSEPLPVRASVGVGRDSVLPETEPKAETETETEAVTVAEPVSLGTFKLTAYCPCSQCCGQWASNRPLDEDGNEIIYGASGERLYGGYSVAVDPTVIPYGTTLYIEGVGYRVAQDCGGAIKGNRIDVYFPTHTEALQFGVQYAEVAIN